MGVHPAATSPGSRLRTVGATVMGASLIVLAGVATLTFHPAWSWSPSWFDDSAPYAAGIGLMVLGLWALGDVWHWAERLWRTIAGAALITAGIAMLVLPGPGLVTIAAGLFVLSREYDWANRQYEKVSEQVNRARRRARASIAARRDARDGDRVLDGRAPLDTTQLPRLLEGRPTLLRGERAAIPERDCA